MHPDSGDVPQGQTKSPLDYISPTELVDLPSKGKYYHPNHPLHNKDTVEIRLMTAKDEDILTSQSLLKKGVALDRFIDGIIKEKGVNSSNLLVGDKNAILIAARVSGYGPEYNAKVTCPSCGANNKHEFYLDDIKPKEKEIDESMISMTDRGTFITRLPFCDMDAEFRLLYGSDESKIAAKLLNKRKDQQESISTDQIKLFIVSVGGVEDREVLNRFVNSMPARDSRHLRKAYRMINPDIDLKTAFSCSQCGHEQEMEVPLSADFFWPDS